MARNSENWARCCSRTLFCSITFLTMSCGQGLENFFTENDPEKARIVLSDSNPQYVSGTGRKFSTIAWQATNSGSWIVRKGNACTPDNPAYGSSEAQNIQPGESQALYLNYETLDLGQNHLIICLTLASTGQLVTALVTAYREETAPTVTPSVMPQTVVDGTPITLECISNCLFMAYNLSGSANISVEGQITQGQQYMGEQIEIRGISGSQVNVSFAAIDRALNITTGSFDYVIQ